MEPIKSVRGTKDIYLPEILRWHQIEGIIRKLMDVYNFYEIRTPIFEETNLFSRGIGDETDIVSKEMYTFLDRSKTSLTLKPEMTASVVRAYIQNSYNQAQSINKFYYLSPMFRQERPQAGRLRQFHQVGAEIFGTKEPVAEAELIILALQLMNECKIDNLQLHINSVGCNACRPNYSNELKKYFENIKSQLSKESQERLVKNPLRILDSKDEADIKHKEHAPSILDFLCEACKLHFDKLLDYLNENSIEYKIDKYLVRGLDYYTKTAFEITTSNLGAQDAICGGGRYDSLVEILGGAPTPAVGWACGIERMILASQKNHSESSPFIDIYFCILDEVIKPKLFSLLTELRNVGLKCETDLSSRSLKAQLREANKKNAKYAVIVGETEFKSNTAIVKNLQESKQEEISLSEIVNYFRKL